MKPLSHRNSFAAFAMLAGLVLSSPPSRAQTVADFYRGKTVSILIGVGVGGEYDARARLLSRHLKKHIPGNPTVVAQNMTGGGGLTMANFLFNLAPKDGTYFGIVPNTFPSMQALGFAGIQFDAAAFQWIGAIAPTVETMATWKSANARTLDDVRQREVIAGASGRGAMTYTFPALMNEVAGTRFRIVLGYQGGSDINLAMERGEVGARNSTWSSWKSSKADWLANGDISIVAYAGPRVRDLANVPNLTDVAKSEADRTLIQLAVGAGAEMGHPFAAPPGVPAERMQTLVEAFNATMTDPEFLQEIVTMKSEVDPVHQSTMIRVVREVFASPPDVRARARKLLE